MALEKENILNIKKHVREKIRKLFEAAQQQFGHQTLIESCRKLHKKCEDENEELFLSEFTIALKFTLVYSEKLAVDNILAFVSKYVALCHLSSEEKELSDSTVDESVPFVSGILRFLFKSHGAALSDARLRCMQLLSKILSSMPENSLISDDIWKKLKETVLCRLQDKNLAVRAQAVLTARMLQDPKNANCEIIKALLFHFNDPSPIVRRAVVSSIALNKITIAHVLGRTRDVNDNVRRNAYLVFSKIKPLNLTIKYRVTILERGLQDRSEMVKKCVEQIVVINWLENFKKDIVKFLEALDVVNCSEIAIKTVEAIIKTEPVEEIVKQLPIDEDKLIPVEKMTPETVLLWRCLAHYFLNEAKDEELEMITPSLTILCEHIRGFYKLEEPADVNLNEEEQWTEVKQKETLKHLLHLIKVFDLRDEMGRCKLKELIVDMLISSRIQNNQIKSLVELLVPVIPNKDSFIQELTEVISEIRQPLRTVVTQLSQKDKMERNLKVSDLKITLNDLKEREYDAVSSKNYVEAHKLKYEIEAIETELKKFVEEPVTLTQEVNEEKNDPITLCKCLSILVELIKCSNVKILTPMLLSLKDNFLNQCMISRDLLTQSLAIEALAQFCILDKEIAQQNLVRFLLMISEDGDNEINIPSLKGTFDIIQTHSLDSLEQLNQNEGGEDQRGNCSNPRNWTLNTGEKSFNGDSPLYEDLNESFSEIKCLRNLNALLYCKTNDTLKAVAYEGLCKLLLSGVVCSTSILTRIIIKGFSPIIDCESEDFIRQTFMVFFPIFASNTPRSQEIIEASFIPTIKSIRDATLGSPDADINPKEVAVFLVHHTKPDINKFTAKTLHVHNNLALSICFEMYRDLSDGKDAGYLMPVYLRSLTQLEVSLESESFVEQLQTLVDKIEKSMKETTWLRSLLLFKKKIAHKLHSATMSSVENTLITTRESRGSSKTMSRQDDSTSSLSLPSGTNLNAQKLTTLAEVTLSDSNDSSGSIGSQRTVPVVVPESPDVSDTD
ncbi:hypothetical protein RUM44_008853 [Polyplax serrata]|uniref:Nuclear condensin complex subunit 3 C-terminal domain-containing protein n=1 Tax=Polyplax serrata TaxID=468196 RepID=A0ABR1BBE0_POLSC